MRLLRRTGPTGGSEMSDDSAPLRIGFRSRRDSLSSDPPMVHDLVMDRAAASPQDDDVAQLIAAVAGGDQTALRSLYDRTSSRLYAITYRLLRSEQEAEEVVQDVYVSVWRRASDFDPGRGQPLAWLATITRNRAIDRLRRKRLPESDLSAAERIADDGPTALDLALAGERREQLGTCLEELEERHRALIRTAFIDGLSYSDLATRENVPLGTMKSWIRRSLLRLRGCMER